MNRSRTRSLTAATRRLIVVSLSVGASAVAMAQGAAPPTPTSPPAAAAPPGAPATTARAVFAGGCFWCVEADFDKVAGVISTTSGYTGGSVPNPSYEQVSAKRTGHAEAVEIVFDPKKVSYEQLVEHFWHTIDPTTKDRQFCDAGSPYRSAIYAQSAEQMKIAQASKAALEKARPFKAPIATEVETGSAFYPAEGYHQDYYLKNPVRYKYYRFNCGRDARLKELWGDKAAGH